MTTEAQKEALIDAVIAWASDREGNPSNIADAELMKSLWTYEGDRTDPCEECDGECGEPCAPCTVKAGHAALDAWIERHRYAMGLLRRSDQPTA